jgi:hypothetical protein
MRINNILTAVFLVLLTAVPAFSADRDMKGTQSEERDAFFARVKTADNLADKNIRAVRDSGYGPFLSYVFLIISRESGKPVNDIIGMRKQGYSLSGIAAACGVDYSKVVEKIEGGIRENNIIFPASDGEESMKDASSTVRTDRGGRK